MKQKMKNKVGAFTLIEMLVVLLIISVLLMLVVPNIIKHQASIHQKGCDAYITVVESQYQVYQMEHPNMKPTIDTLYAEKYVKSTTCPDGTKLNIDGEGHAQKV